MAAYRWFYDSRHLQADCQEPDHLRNATDVDISVRSFWIKGGLTTLISKLLFGRMKRVGDPCQIPRGRAYMWS